MTELIDLIKLTQHMHELAKSGNWEEVTKLHPQQQHILQEFFSNNPQIDDDEALRKLFNIEQELIKLSEAARDEVKQDVLSLRNSKKAIESYNTSRHI